MVEDPRVALIFLVPGANETYRVNGRARVSVDPVLRRRFAVDGKEPTTVIVVAIEQAFQHCPKALVRSDLWKAGSGDRPKGIPTLGDFAAARTPGIDSSAYDAEYALAARAGLVSGLSRGPRGGRHFSSPRSSVQGSALP